jgi:hypothetical protein
LLRKQQPSTTALPENCTAEMSRIRLDIAYPLLVCQGNNCCRHMEHLGHLPTRGASASSDNALSKDSPGRQRIVGRVGVRG